MFSGIIEQKGQVLNVQAKAKFTEIRIEFEKTMRDIQTGESIAVNGVCLTVTQFTEKYFMAQVIGETLKATNLGLLEKGMSVNLERALRYDGKVSGHFVSGHVDHCGKINGIKQKNNDYYFDIECPLELMPFFTVKGSVAIDGISLTIQAIRSRVITVSIIPHTLNVTNLGDRRKGQLVNLEIDLIARYAQKQLEAKKMNKTMFSFKKLEKMGF
jgi:riboflavin synthase